MQDIPRGNAHSEQASTVAPYERDQQPTFTDRPLQPPA